MSRYRVGEKVKKTYSRAMRDVIKGLGRKVIVHRPPKKLECPNCYFDGYAGSSTGKCKWTVDEALQKQAEWLESNPGQVRYQWFGRGRCPICKGKGVIELKRETGVDCLVVWDTDERFGNTIAYSEAGSEGASSVILQTDPKYLELFRTSIGLAVDGIDCKVSKPPVMEGLGNQTILVVMAFTVDKPKADSGEVVKDY